MTDSGELRGLMERVTGRRVRIEVIWSGCCWVGVMGSGGMRCRWMGWSMGERVWKELE